MIPLLYISGIVIIVATVFKNVELGLSLMVGLIPQPNIYYKFYDLPLGKDFLDILFFAILLGIFINKKGFAGTENSILIFLFVALSFLELWNSSMRFSLPLPVTTENAVLKMWKNYAEMILLYFLALNAVKDENKQKHIVIIMSLVVLFISVRSYRNFTEGSSFVDERRYGGPFEVVGLGSNHLGAFIAHYSAVFLGLFFYDKVKWRKLLFLATVLFSLHPLFFSYSRGAYMAAFGVVIFYGIVKKRSLLILVFAMLLAWQVILPASVTDRIMMTETEGGELESSAAVRLKLWEDAMNLFHENPLFGAGFDGFTLAHKGEHWSDTHNFYLKTLSEQGIVGIIFLMLIFIMAFRSGWRLYNMGRTTFYQGLGFGFMGSVIAIMITNIFGDRWSYFMLGSYFWIFWGLVDRGILISKASGTQEVKIEDGNIWHSAEKQKRVKASAPYSKL